MKIFISHSSHDKWVARQLSNQLISEGHETFLDEKDIKTGDSIDSEIQNHLKDSDHLLIVVSPSSLKSHWVFIEIGGAKALGIKVIPILLHVEANEIPAPISQLLAREINDFDKYIEEISSKPTRKKRHIKPAKAKKSAGGFTVGDKVRVVDVDHLNEEDKSAPPKWTARMDKFSGSIATIMEFGESGFAILDIDDDSKKGVTWWRTEWLQKIN